MGVCVYGAYGAYMGVIYMGLRSYVPHVWGSYTWGSYMGPIGPIRLKGARGPMGPWGAHEVHVWPREHQGLMEPIL